MMLRDVSGPRVPRRTSTCPACDDEGRIWMGHNPDTGRLRFRYCTCTIGQELKAKYGSRCPEKQAPAEGEQDA